MTVILDAGALVAIERRDRAAMAFVAREQWRERMPVTHGGVVGQVWRGGGPRQAVVARVLAGIRVIPLDDELGRRVGALLARTDASDVIDAALVLLAQDGDEILTSDPDDLGTLLAASGTRAAIVTV